MAKAKKKSKSKNDEKLSINSKDLTTKNSNKKSNKSNSSATKSKTKTISTTSTTQSNPKNNSIFRNSPIYDLLHYFEKAPDQWVARYILILTSILIRSSISLGNYSGFNTPPMYGDFEAQRHWMELTINLPTNKWYFYDLNYWGLDYPPLTAYHSYILGKIGSFFDSQWFELDNSRGFESLELKFFMRFSVLISEIIIFIPSIMIIAKKLSKKFNWINRIDQIILCFLVLNQPHLILIDHGHFQYNCVMLGFFILTIINLIDNNFIWASFWFVSCINFKQMGLYYSIFIFFYILSQLKNLKQLITVGLTVIITQLVFILPFLLQTDFKTQINQIIIRIFPFNRGLFEDKVSNFWCISNIILKYKSFLNLNQLSKLSLAATLASIIPINLILFFKLRKVTDKNDSEKRKIKLMIFGFSYNSLSFYLFSYQVHEKSILVPIIPIILNYFFITPTSTSVVELNFIQWINNLSTFSLYPLLKKDELILQYFVLIFLINWLIGFKNLLPKITTKRISIQNLNAIIIYLTYFLVVIYHILDFFVATPQNLPDLWVILNCFISFLGFIYFWIWLIYLILIT
ncbi:ALG6 [Candida pseudojiufengensis]|uniref:ALG6 n=1 Tax=Candida pseudojiufengensis TaxID=497109 RepID=UPI00222434F7|nr:ALG6 [Candida pseudojiufengensis]KAI5962618.1 ALG6 [Candida pseudojiufengensis]